ncbi:Atu4866 domain-containing protein [Vineibacter terrae]|nr:Atu4866 domain-containing protein [Vineibacter terrae]
MRYASTDCTTRRLVLRAMVAMAAGAGAIAATTAIAQPEPPMTEQRFVGMWVTADSHIRLELRSDGRYDEARGTRKGAYTGRYTARGNDLHFVDDSGFTATGRLVDGVLTVGPDIFRRE